LIVKGIIMHRIYRIELTEDMKLRTLFFNGEIRELEIEIWDEATSIEERVNRYAQLIESIRLNEGRTKVSLGERIFSSEEIYDQGTLVGLEYIDDVNIQVATKLQSIRESKNLTQSDLHDITGIYQAEISKIERGIGNPSISTLVRLADSMDRRITIDFENRSIRRDVPCNLAAAPFLNASRYQGEFTIQDIMCIPEDVKVELLEGCIFDLAQPSVNHQMIAAFIFNTIFNHIKDNNGACKTLYEVGVTFEEDENDYLVPDIVVVCNPEKIEENHILGAPDFVIEIASKSDYRRDYGIKQKIYMEKGVREYWIIDPMKKCVVVYYYEEDCIPRVFTFDDVVPVEIFGGRLMVCLSEFNESR